MTIRADAFPERRIEAGYRAACGHLAPCGCQHWRQCCTSCPYPDCKLTGVPGCYARQAANAPRNAEVVTLRDAGASIDDICDRFQLGKRTVFRILQQARKCPAP